MFADKQSETPQNNVANTTVIANIVNSELPSVRKKERDYVGMFEFSKNDIPAILRILVIGKCNH